MSNGKLDIASHLNEHTYPGFLMRHPKLIHWIYWWNRLILQRNWVARKAIKRELKMIKRGNVLDAGCGEGLHLLPYASKYDNIHFVGIDKNIDNITFCEKYIEKTGLKNTSVIRQKLEKTILVDKFKLIWSIGTLQYIENDQQVFSNFFNILKKGGTLIIYTPVYGSIILPIYRDYFDTKNNYEKSQTRKRIYQPNELEEKLKNAGFSIESTRFTYGKTGILAHEIYSLLLMGISSNSWATLLFGALLALLLPIIFLLKTIDHLVPKKSGNGLLIIAKKS